MRCVLVGNYGVGNVGDEALREFFLKRFSDVQWTVVSGNAGATHEVPRLPLGVRSLFAPWWKTINAIRTSDGMVFGGGSLFSDIESVWACVLWGTYALVAWILRTPYFLAFQGIGPFRTAIGRSIARWVAEHAKGISVRDEASLKRISIWKLQAPPVLTFDPAFALFSMYHRQTSEKRMLVIIPRSNSTEEFFEAAGKKMNAYDEVRILLLEPLKEEESAARLTHLTHTSAEIIQIHSVQELMQAISVATEVLTQRYHGGLAALAMGIPLEIVSQKVGDKLDVLRTVIREGKEELLLSIGKGSKALRESLEKNI